MPGGGLLLFDFRVLHRGMPNSSGRMRPLAHAVLATGLAEDGLSYPERSLRAEVNALPREPAARDAVRTALMKQQTEAWAAVRASSTS